MNSERIRKIQKDAKALLILPSLAYGGIVSIKNVLYDKNLLKSQVFSGVKIISVGNIAAGGVGKTPIVIEIANALIKYGKVCIITGSYPTKDKRVNIVSLEGKIFKKPPAIPDEAYMIAKKTNACVISSKSRKAALELSIGLNMKYVILDDALHKRNIKKDVEICVVDKEKPFENGLYLPAGMLRDAKSSIKRCDITICTNKTNCTKKTIMCNEALFKPIGIFNNKNEKINNAANAFIFCGIGNPVSFLKSIESMGIEVKGYKFFNDHHIYSKKDISMLKKLKKNKKAEILLTTYKDFVKMEQEDVCYLDIALKIENFDKIIQRIA